MEVTMATPCCYGKKVQLGLINGYRRCNMINNFLLQSDKKKCEHMIYHKYRVPVHRQYIILETKTF